jgi:hypothetical protein
VDPSELEELEPRAEWRRSSVENPDVWTEHLDQGELRELNEALQHAKARSTDVLELGRGDFPLPLLSVRLQRIERELIDGRGFVLIRGIPRDRYDKDDASLLYWGIGMHLFVRCPLGPLLPDERDADVRAGPGDLARCDREEDQFGIRSPSPPMRCATTVVAGSYTCRS